MFNNEITYDDKWKTPENLKAEAEVERRFFHKSVCSPSCPTSWAQEVLDLLNLFEKELGIQWNEQTIRAYRVDGNLWDWLVKGPVLSAWGSVKYHFIDKKSEYYTDKGLAYKLLAPVKSFFERYAYAKNAIRVKYVAPIMNRLLKPKFTLSQVKEKYGRLEIYYSCPETHEAWVEEQITKTRIKLSLKGAYYPLESFWDAKRTVYLDSKYNDELTEIVNYTDSQGQPQTKVTTTVYRKLMKDMGLDTNDLENRAAAVRKNDEEES